MRRETIGVVVGALLAGGCAATPPEPQETPLTEAILTLPEVGGPREREIHVRPDGTVTDDAGTGGSRARDVPVLPIDPGATGTAVGRGSGNEGAQHLLAGLLADDERFGTVRVEPGGELTLVWHGDPPQEALAALAQAHPDVPVRVQPIPVLPGELAALAESLVGGDRRPRIGAAHVQDDLAAIVAQVEGPVPNPLTLAERLTAEVGFPVVVEVLASVPGR
jgi:hypothetical protein